MKEDIGHLQTEFKDELMAVKEEVSSRSAKSSIKSWMKKRVTADRRREAERMTDGETSFHYSKLPPPPSDPPAPHFTRYIEAEQVDNEPFDSTKDNKRVTLPEFDGTSCVKGFLTMFEYQCEEVHYGKPVSDRKMKTYLLSQLKGTAKLWVEGLGDAWKAWSYQELAK